MNTIVEYVQQGFLHVIPLGFDHILFITSLFFLHSNLKSVLLQCSLFTLAHSITLFLSAYQIILPNSNYIEPLIALSIVFTSIENIFRNEISTWRMALVFCFGLIHGMGFANAFQHFGMPKNEFIVALFSFNIGVELAQVSILVFIFLAIASWSMHKVWYKQRIAYPISCIIACIAMYWFVERIANS